MNLRSEDKNTYIVTAINYYISNERIDSDES